MGLHNVLPTSKNAQLISTGFPIDLIRGKGVFVKLVYEYRLKPRFLRSKRKPAATSEQVNERQLILSAVQNW